MGYRQNYRRRYRKKGNIGRVVTDLAAVAAGTTPKKAVLWGFFSFGFLYYFMPWMLAAWVEYNKAKMSGPLAGAMGQMLDHTVIRRFIHPLEWAGIACLVVCLAIAAWKQLTGNGVSKTGANNASRVARFVARFLD